MILNNTSGTFRRFKTTLLTGIGTALATCNFAVFYSHREWLSDGTGFLLTALSILFLLLLTPRPKVTRAWFLPVLLTIGYISFFLLYSLESPVWSEERGWLDLSYLIRHGDLLNPFVPKSDFPSSFQSWLIAFLAVLTNAPVFASRLAGILYSVAALYFIYKTVRLLHKTGSAGVWFMVVPALNTCLVFSFLTGWHEITSVPLLIVAPWYYCLVGWLAESLEDRQKSAIPFGAWSAAAFWTLYTPALMTVVLWPFYLGARVSSRTKLQALLSFALLMAPLAGEVAATRGQYFARHFSFFVYGRDGENNRIPSLQEKLDLYQNLAVKTSGKAFSMKVPEAWDDLEQFQPGPVLLPATAIGIVTTAVIFGVRGLAIVLLPALALTLGVMMSNPTMWRESCLGVPFLLLGALGLRTIDRIRGRLWLTVVRSVLVSVIVLAQAYWFSLSFNVMRNYFNTPNKVGHFQIGHLADLLLTRFETYPADSMIGISDPNLFGLLRGMSRRPETLRLCQSAVECTSERIIVGTDSDPYALSSDTLGRYLEHENKQFSLEYCGDEPNVTRAWIYTLPAGRTQ